MKKSIIYIIILLAGFCPPPGTYAQSPERYSNSFHIQYGLFNYNSSHQSSINADNSFFSIGARYRHQLGRITAVNISGRYYEWQMDAGNKLNTSAAQVTWVIHPRRISSAWSINRVTPYLGAGIGLEKHNLKKTSGLDSGFSNLYVPVEAGIQFNLSSRWSVGIFAEYKLASTGDIKKLANVKTGNMDIINTAGVSLAYHFTKNENTVRAPLVYTDPFLKEVPAKPGKEHFRRNATRPPQPEEKQLPELGHNTLPTLKPIPGKDSLDANSLTITDSAEFLPSPSIVSDVDLSRNNPDSLKPDSIVSKNAPYDPLQPRKKSPGDTLRPGKNLAPDITLQEDSVITPNKKPAKKVADTLRNDTTWILPTIINDSIAVIRKIAPRPVDQQAYIDSLLEVIEEQGQKAAIPQVGPLTADEPTKIIRERTRDTLFNQPTQIGMYDDPSIARLKRTYNLMNESMERNYRNGVYNDTDLRRVQSESARIRNNLQELSQENDVAFDELANLYDSIAQLQMKINQANATAIAATAPVSESNISTLQNKLDRTLIELEYIRKIQSLEPVSNTRTAEMERLQIQQQSLENRLNQLEMENMQLNLRLQQKPGLVKKENLKETSPDNKILLTVNFGLNSAVVGKGYLPGIKNLADSLSRIRGNMLLLSGFSDKSGNAAYNYALSQRRVTAIKNELVKAGLPKEQIVERYFGSDKADKAKSQNDRKVVIRLILP